MDKKQNLIKYLGNLQNIKDYIVGEHYLALRFKGTGLFGLSFNIQSQIEIFDYLYNNYGYELMLEISDANKYILKIRG